MAGGRKPSGSKARWAARLGAAGAFGQALLYLVALAMNRDVETASIVGTALGMLVGGASMMWRILRHRSGRATGAFTAALDSTYDRVGAALQVYVTAGFLVGLILTPFVSTATIGSTALLGTAVGALASVPGAVRAITGRDGERLPPGTNVRRWEIREFLAEGGWGDVYLAECDRALGALKIPRRRKEFTSEARHRFEQELRSTRAIRSRRAAGFVDTGEYHGVPFLVTEYAGPTSLASRIALVGQLDEDEIVAVAVQLAEALTDVHAQGFIHRDVKPSNIVLTSSGLKLIDFGISCDLARARRDGGVERVGTSEFAAPEQLAHENEFTGVGHQLSTASDVFAWASTVFAAATGDAPFGRPGHLDDSSFRRRLCESTVDLAGVPVSLRPVLDSAFAKDATARPTAAELVARLGPGATTPAAWADALANRSHRAPKRVLVAGVAAVLVAVAASAQIVPRRDRPGEAAPATVTSEVGPTSSRTSSSTLVKEGPTTATTAAGVTPESAATTTTVTTDPSSATAVSGAPAALTPVVSATPVDASVLDTAVSSDATTASTSTNATLSSTTQATTTQVTAATTVGTPGPTTAATSAPCQPPAPGKKETSRGDGYFTAALVPLGCVDHLMVTWSPSGPPNPVRYEVGSVKVTGLQNCTQYTFTVHSVSADGLFSDPAVYQGTPAGPADKPVIRSVSVLPGQVAFDLAPLATNCSSWFGGEILANGVAVGSFYPAEGVYYANVPAGRYTFVLRATVFTDGPTVGPKYSTDSVTIGPLVVLSS